MSILDDDPSVNIEIELEDLNRLFEMNPLAGVQFQNILKDKQIAQLEKRLAERNGHNPNNITEILSGESITSQEN
tara:strand:- start:19075 stop:19299 length:225 start_codon:yes stop_codon:yes gene_type:complete